MALAGLTIVTCAAAFAAPTLLPRVANGRSGRIGGDLGSERRDVGKDLDYWTTSTTFKHDLRSFFDGVAQNWTALELGSYRGYTTRVLSELFKKVIAIDASESFLGDNQKNNADRDNILYLRLHSQLDGLRSLQHNQVHVVLVDAEHNYEAVSRDLREVLQFLGHSLRFVLFDDYATDEGVRKAVTDFVLKGNLQLVGGLGNQPPWSYQGGMVHDWEGVVCEAVRTPRNEDAIISRSSSAVEWEGWESVKGRWFAWFVDNLMFSEDIIEFNWDGSVATSRGPGTWRRDDNRLQGSFPALVLQWYSHKPPQLGGIDGSMPTLETWFVQFDPNCDKFVASHMNDSTMVAAGIATDVLQTLVRRLFVSLHHEFCNTANECAQKQGALNTLIKKR